MFTKKFMNLKKNLKFVFVITDRKNNRYKKTMKYLGTSVNESYT